MFSVRAPRREGFSLSSSRSSNCKPPTFRTSTSSIALVLTNQPP